METKSGKWSIPEVETVIKVILLEKESYRYTDIKKEIEKGGRPITGKMLSNGLKSLETKEQIIGNKQGREKYYKITYEPTREENIALIKLADKMLIDMVAPIGILTEPDNNWSMYGIPKGISNRIGNQIGRSVKNCIEDIDVIISDETYLVIDKLLKLAKDRLGHTELQKAKKALEYLFDDMTSIGIQSKRGIMSKAFLDEFVPGTSDRLLSDFVNCFSEPADYPARIDYLVRQGYSKDDCEKELGRSLSHKQALTKLLSILSSSRDQKVVEEFGQLLTAAANWCAVIR